MSVHAVIGGGQVAVCYDLLADPGQAPERLISISTPGEDTALGLVSLELCEVPGVVMALQRVLREARQDGLELGRVSTVAFVDE